MNRTGRWWSRTRGLPADVHATWRDSLQAEGIGSARILAWATGDEQRYAIGGPARLSVGSADGWRHTGWHEIEHGGWNAETQVLSWKLYEGRRGSVSLDEPARLPELFRERVAASIAVEKFIPLTALTSGDDSGEAPDDDRGARRGVTIAARRDLAQPTGILVWHASVGRGLTWQTPGVREAADHAMAALRVEYDISGIG